MGDGGILGLMASVTLFASTTKQLLGEVNVELVVKAVGKSIELSKKHGVSIIGDLTKGKVEDAMNEATAWLLDEIETIEGKTVTTPITITNPVAS